MTPIDFVPILIVVAVIGFFGWQKYSRDRDMLYSDSYVAGLKGDMNTYMSKKCRDVRGD